MQFYHFSEQPYTDAWSAGLDSLRNTIPNRLCDPKVASRIYNEALDEWLLCDELGINCMLNEHHTSATCISESPNIQLGILARQTRNVRILGLGHPIAVRSDPVRLAEELAMIDCISGGRLEIGFVKGAPYEYSPANANPVGITERFWEAHDLILKALSSRDGPFNFEGDHHHFRQVNIWPRPWQDPHPPVWVTVGSPESTFEVATRQHRIGVFLAGWNVGKLFDLYRKRTAELGFAPPSVDRFGYMALVAVGETQEEGFRRAHEIQGYLRTTGQIGEAYVNPPGYMSAQGNVKWLKQNQLRGRSGNHFPATTRDGRVINQATAPIEDLVAAAVCFAGNPDQVYEQICAFVDSVGGLGHLFMMCHGGFMTHKESGANLTLFAREVAPRLRERYPVAAEGVVRHKLAA
jgi:alkanesulfonate monooxygenase SsuD/methylene tetrahydromethanopterin reductase-like flavin-dependent oxidoreductase (luciferase family)